MFGYQFPKGLERCFTDDDKNIGGCYIVWQHLCQQCIIDLLFKAIIFLRVMCEYQQFLLESGILDMDGVADFGPLGCFHLGRIAGYEDEWNIVMILDKISDLGGKWPALQHLKLIEYDHYLLLLQQGLQQLLYVLVLFLSVMSSYDIADVDQQYAVLLPINILKFANKCSFASSCLSSDEQIVDCVGITIFSLYIFFNLVQIFSEPIQISIRLSTFYNVLEIACWLVWLLHVQVGLLIISSNSKSILIINSKRVFIISIFIISHQVSIYN